MRKLSLPILAASIAFTPSGAFAQVHHPGPPPAGHSWRGGVTGMPARGPNVRHHGGVTGMRGHRPNVVVRHGGGRFGHPGPNFRHRRLQRGFVIHPFWFGPQFHVNNWQMYGFADPGGDSRWVRYYDDAYLIDRDGRVRDTRYGMDWDQYGEEWDLEDGIPAYRGSRDWRPDDDDYAWAERHGETGPGNNMGGWDYSQYGHGGGYAHTQVYGGAYGGYGYGYGYAYPIIIETTVTTAAAATYTEEVVEEYVQVRRPRRAHRRARCVCAPPRPAVRPAPRPAPVRRPPPAGERG